MRRELGDRGDSLVEILAAVTILAIGITGLLTALGTHVTTTIANRSQTKASTTLLEAAEYVKALPYAACGPASAVPVSTTQLPRDSAFSVTYGPGHQLGSTSCSDLTIVPVTVSGDGFTLHLDVAKRP
jgi:Tfp pilus assembly protein PilV